MDALSISSIANLAAEQHGLAGKTKQLASKADEHTGQGTNAETDKSSSLVNDTARPGSDFLVKPHRLTRKSAWAFIGDVAAQIESSHPWKLAELQPVAGKTLIPSAYV